MRKWISAIAASALLTLPLQTSQAANPKVGATCSKQGVTKTYKNRKFTCIKSGKKLVWNKGVIVVKPNPTTSHSPLPSASPTPTPTPTQSTVIPKEFSNCTIPNQTIYLETTLIKCISQDFGRSRDEMRWKIIPKYNAIKNIVAKENAIPNEMSNCSNSGDRYTTTNFYLECRYVHGGSLKWIKINTEKKNYTISTSPNGIEPCKLKNSDGTRLAGDRNQGVGAGFAGFPINSINNMNNPGTNKVLIVGIDFADVPGGENLSNILEEDKKGMNDWISYFSGGKMKFDITTIDTWIHAPKNASFYDRKTSKTSANPNYDMGVEAQEYINLITEKIDLRPFSTVYVRHPLGTVQNPDELIVRNHKFTTKEGEKSLNFFNYGRPLEVMGTYGWAYFIHESLHDLGIIGHAPGNGWPMGIMQDQSGVSMATSGWEQFLLGWLPDNQIYCTSQETIIPSTVSLSPMEREDNKTKIAVVKTSKTTAIVVEAHGIDKWSNFNLNDRSFPPGFYGVVVYTIDLDLVGAPPVTQTKDGIPFEDDDGNNRNYPRYAYFVKVDGGKSFLSEYISLNQFAPRYNEYFGVLGDSFTLQGVKITLISTGDYETIKIEKVG